MAYCPPVIVMLVGLFRRKAVFINQSSLQENKQIAGD
jgi:hypothetical protein